MFTFYQKELPDHEVISLSYINMHSSSVVNFDNIYSIIDPGYCSISPHKIRSIYFVS